MSIQTAPQNSENRPSRLPKKVFKGHTGWRIGRHDGSDIERGEWQAGGEGSGARLGVDRGNGGHKHSLLAAETGEGMTRERLRFGDEVYCLSFPPDGTRIAAGSQSEKGNVRVFDVLMGETTAGPSNTHTPMATSIVFTLDEKPIITVSNEGFIRVWDSTTGQNVVQPMLGHKGGIAQTALSHDGRRLASAGLDGTIRVWDTNPHASRLHDPPMGGPLSLETSRAISTFGIPLPPRSRTQPPVFTAAAGSPLSPQPSTSKPSTVLASRLPAAGAPPPAQLNSSHPPQCEDFWDTSDLNARLSPLDQYAHRRPRQDRNNAREMHSIEPYPISAPPVNALDMQPPPRPPRVPTSRAANVSAAYGFNAESPDIPGGEFIVKVFDEFPVDRMAPINASLSRCLDHTSLRNSIYMKDDQYPIDMAKKMVAQGVADRSRRPPTQKHALALSRDRESVRPGYQKYLAPKKTRVIYVTQSTATSPSTILMYRNTSWQVLYQSISLSFRVSRGY
ncbi:hypothetical protein BJ138DRAFT_1117371 [Hygrophoropsis aurantiaca]|uniref:Uncharacterized protein n=1 Tax=Hygrophoropsis aurantiaca TaxID=72124 RepID=A0ACB7ZZV4_9AGAM|nr:hypothetical protein BJ138DRAFT_1117371 [Hygrophoropsis aurantiaca]